MPGMNGVLGAGPGTRGSMPTPSSLEMASGIARSAGGFIHPGGSLTHLSSGMVTATAADATSITSATTEIGKHVRLISQVAATPMASTVGRAPWAVVFTLDLEWPELEASVDLDAADSIAEAVVSTAAALEDSTVGGFTVVVEATANLKGFGLAERCGSRPTIIRRWRTKTALESSYRSGVRTCRLSGLSGEASAD